MAKYFMKSVREVLEKSHEGPRIIVQSFNEKYFSTKFHHFRAKYFSSFRNFPSLVLDTVMSPELILYRSLLIYVKHTKNNYSQHKFATP